MKRVLITGISGFVGSFLAEWCLKMGCEVYGLERPGAEKGNLMKIKSKIHMGECDINHMSQFVNLLYEMQPEWIFHLAAQSYVPLSWKEPQDTLKTNIIGQVNLFEALRKLNLKPRIQIAGSSEQYGWVKKEEIPITEDQPFRPLSPYAVSKVAQDLLAYQYHQTHKLDVVRTRAFNHTGPRRSELFVASSFAKQIVQIEKGQATPELHVGNLEAVRDFLDVRDVVRAYYIAMEKADAGEAYNISSGKGRSIQDVLNVLIGKTKVSIEVKPDPSRLRPSDLPIVVGSSDKFRMKTGWKPEISFDQTMQDLMDYWRSQMS